MASGQSGYQQNRLPRRPPCVGSAISRTFDFQPSNLKVSNDYFRRYTAIDGILAEAPAILDLVHRDLKKVLDTMDAA